MNTIFPNLKKVVFGKDVKAIGENAFSVPSDKTNNIETIVFEGNPVDVGSSAFRYNTKLAKIGKVKSVGTSSFSNCSSLESIEITGDDVVDASAFSACSSLKSVTLPNTLTTINQYAFKDCIGLTSIEIPSNVTSINVEAFRTATNLSKVKISSASVVNPSTPYSETRNLGKIFPYATEVDLNLPMGNNNAIGNYAFYGATALKSIIRATKVTEIGANAFKGCTNLVLGDDRYFINTWGYVQTIGESAFEGCTSLKFDELTKNVTTINAAAFKGCTGLTSLILPEKLATVALDAFEGCVNLTNVTINGNAFAGAKWATKDNLRIRFPYATDITFGKNVTSVGDYAFYSSQSDNNLVKRITFYGNPSVGEYAFCDGKNIESVTGSIKSVSQYSFAGCKKLPSITITDDDVIEEWAFGQCSALKSVTLPDNLKELQYAAFLWCSSLAEIQLPNTVEKFQRAIFKGCTSLKEITLPATVSTFNAQVFMNCSNLAKVTVLNPTPVALTESMDVFNGISATAELNVPGSSLNAYKTAEVWKNFYSYFASDGIKLVDGEPYTRTVSEVVPMVRYTRTFSEKNVGKWQSFYVPFDIEITEELLADYEFAKLYMVSYQDANNNDIIDSTDPLKMIFNKVKVGSTLKGNTPYYIKAKRLDTKPIEVVNTLLLAAENGSVDCRTTEDEYTLIGVNEPTIVQWKYVMANSGNFTRITSPTSKLGSFRWYMEIKSRNEDENDNYARPILIEVEGENDVTSIVDVNGFAPKSEIKKVYTLEGRQVTDIDNLPSGIYIINGKKVVKK